MLINDTTDRTCLTLTDEQQQLIVAHLTDSFANLFNDEKRCVNALQQTHPEEWANKKIVLRYKESFKKTCDVCMTTLFNLRLFCRDCCMQVCLQCAVYRFARSPMNPGVKVWPPEASEFGEVNYLFDELNWPKCTTERRPVHNDP